MLPQLNDRLFITDGGIETTLIFHDGLQLPEFAAFSLLKDQAGAEALRRYFRTYASIAERYRTGLILESATWRASADWGEKLGYSAKDLAVANRQAIKLLRELRDEFKGSKAEVVISGCLGPRGDGYIPSQKMSPEEAERYHLPQIATLTDAGVDLISVMTINYVEEAIGIVRAAATRKIPVVISFTVETDGKLPTGQTLQAAIEQVEKTTDGTPAYYMINCAHPTHFHDAIAVGGAWTERIRGLRANASRKSHAELNDSTELDIGNPTELGREYLETRKSLPKLNIVGGCCGTDHRHVEEITKACTPLFR